MIGPLVPVEWLARHHDAVRVLDVRGEVVDGEPRYRAYPERYQSGHLPGAVFVDWRHDFTDRSATVPVTVAGPSGFAAEATRLGIGATTTVVAYDDHRNALAGRIVWVLRSYGHQAAFVLDGGLGAWLAAGLPWSLAGSCPSRRCRRIPCRSAWRGWSTWTACAERSTWARRWWTPASRSSTPAARRTRAAPATSRVR